MSILSAQTPAAPLVTPWGPLVAYRRKDGSLSLEWKLRGVAVHPTWTRASGAEAEKLLAAATAALAGDERAAKRIPTPTGTPFQVAVWNACRSIPKGKTQTYGWIAKRLGKSPVACRAVGQAMKRNPLPMIVPCHRVVAADGLGGFAGATEGVLCRLKQGILDLESGETQTKKR
ncbi:MAG: methylated-DNA--[protein]-cysteine S-methyltransferase [Phycisphaerales bacterium]|nr:methylated-DNA--[protein]-cysteine S-methyltransferase [Phycisphaerales bacterium]